MSGIPYEDLYETFKSLGKGEVSVIPVVDLINHIRESITLAPSGHEKQRLYELLKDAQDLLQTAEQPYVKEVIDYGKPFLGQSGKFAFASFDSSIPQLFVRFMATPEMRAAGMQAYNSMDYGHGLFFPHEPAQDVTYHMGNTLFPIDIVFLELDGFNGDGSVVYMIGKVVSNVSPGTTDLFNHSKVSAVLETTGGFARKFDIRPGDGAMISDQKYFVDFPN